MMSGWFGGQKTRQNANDATSSSGVQKRGAPAIDTPATGAIPHCDEESPDLAACATDYDSNGNELTQHVHQSPQPYHAHGTLQKSSKSGSEDTSDLSDIGPNPSGVYAQQPAFDSHQYDTPSSRTHRRKRAIERARRERAARQRAAGQPPAIPRPIISSTGLQSFPGVRIDAPSLRLSDPPPTDGDNQSEMSDDTPLGDEYLSSDRSAEKYTSSSKKRRIPPSEKPKKKKTKSTASAPQAPVKIKNSPSANRTAMSDKIKKEQQVKTSHRFAASKVSSSFANDRNVRMMELQREVPLLAPGDRKHYLERAVQFVELHRAQLSRLEKSPMYVFLREVEGSANVDMKNLVSNWNSSIVRKQRIVGMSNVMLMARALQCLERNLQRGDAMRRKRAVQTREDEEYEDSNEQEEEEEEEEDDSAATSMKRYGNTFNREYEQNYESETAFERSRTKGGVRYKVSDLDSSSIHNEPSTAAYRYILPNGMQSDADESADNLQDDMPDEEAEMAAGERNEFPPEEGGVEPPQPLPRDVYQEVREYMTELRQYAQQLYMRNAATDVVREMLSAQHTGELETTGAFDAAVQQALMQAGQYNPKLDDAVLEDFLVDRKARCLMAQLVGHHITRNGLLAPRRDQKMVQLPANKTSIESVLAQMMYLEWRLDGVMGRHYVCFNSSMWHTVRRQRMESAMSFGGRLSGISRYTGTRIDFANNHASPGLYTYV